MKILLLLEFDGTAFCGWQFQPGARTVQGVMSAAAKQVYGEACLVTGCSRTDSGVHARGFCCTLHCPDAELSPSIPPEKLPAVFSGILPPDVSVLRAAAVSDGFHPRYSAVGKEYEYVIRNAPVRSPFAENREYLYTQEINGDALLKMRRAAEYMTGKKDFSAFMAAGSKITDTVRDLKRLTAERDGERIVITAAADGFLYNMVRIICGTLLDVARKATEPEDLPAIIASHNRARAGATLPPHGLYLTHVDYGTEMFV